MYHKKGSLHLSRNAVLAVVVVLIIVIIVLITNLGDKHLRFLKADNITTITITDEISGQTTQASDPNDIFMIVQALREVTTYANVRSKDALGGQLIFTICYADSRKRNVILADPSRTSKTNMTSSSSPTDKAVIQINNRWYKTNSKTVSLLYRTYEETH